MIKDHVTITGALLIEVFDKDGLLKERVYLKNLVVTTGKNHMAARLVGTPTAMGWMALGTGTNAPAVGDTGLQTEIAGSRITIASATSAANVVTFSTTFGAGIGTGAVTEAGIFNASSAGTMLSRVTFSVVSKGPSDTMSITWTISVN